MIRTGGTAWRYARYRRELVYVADRSTAADRLDLFPDTIREDELVLFAGSVGGIRTRPAWQDRSEAGIEVLQRPRAVSLDEATALFVHRRCLNGSGGCQDHPYLLSAGGVLVALEPAHLEALDSVLPKEWGAWKGVWIDTVGPAATAGIHLPGDPGCCPAFGARMRLRVEDDRLVAEGVVLRPNTTGGFWRIDPVEGRFGPVASDVSEEDLRAAVGASQVVRADVYLAEGFCTPGVRVLPDTPWEVEVAWADSGRSRPAFARVRSWGRSDPAGPEPGVFHTPEGVRLGTPLERLEELAGGAIRFGGFDWDYGGGAAWTVEGGTVRLRLDYDRESMAALASGPDSVRLYEVLGDRLVTSDHPLVARLGIRVVGMRLEWRAPEVEGFCG